MTVLELTGIALRAGMVARCCLGWIESTPAIKVQEEVFAYLSYRLNQSENARSSSDGLKRVLKAAERRESCAGRRLVLGRCG